MFTSAVRSTAPVALALLLVVAGGCTRRASLPAASGSSGAEARPAARAAVDVDDATPDAPASALLAVVADVARARETGTTQLVSDGAAYRAATRACGLDPAALLSRVTFWVGRYGDGALVLRAPGTAPSEACGRAIAAVLTPDSVDLGELATASTRSTFAIGTTSGVAASADCVEGRRARLATAPGVRAALVDMPGAPVRIVFGMRRARETHPPVDVDPSEMPPAAFRSWWDQLDATGFGFVPDALTMDVAVRAAFVGAGANASGQDAVRALVSWLNRTFGDAMSHPAPGLPPAMEAQVAEMGRMLAAPIHAAAERVETTAGPGVTRAEARVPLIGLVSVLTWGSSRFMRQRRLAAGIADTAP